MNPVRNSRNKYFFERFYSVKNSHEISNGVNNKGFTLLEITIVVSIIILLSVIFVANYRGGEKQYALKRSAHQLAQDIRRAQEMALSGQEFQGAFQGGFGIHLEVTSAEETTGTYTLFVDCDNEKDFDTGFTCYDCTGESCIGPLFSEEIEIFSFETGIKIVTPLDIVFFPPDPEITINEDPNLTETSVVLSFDGQFEKTITINKVGLIEVE